MYACLMMKYVCDCLRSAFIKHHRHL